MSADVGRRRTAAQLLAVVATAGAVGWLVPHLVLPPWHGLFDLGIYRGAVDGWLDGRPLYDYTAPHSRYGFTYPPVAALLMTPLAGLTAVQAGVLVTAGSAAVVVAGTWWLLAPVARRAGWPPWCATALAVPVVLLVEPVRETLGYGQVNLFLAALVVADVVALRRGRRWAGAGIGLAAALKLTPGIFVVHLLLTRRLRAAAVAAATFLAATGVAFAVAPGTSVRFWGSAGWDVSRAGSPENPNKHSLLAALARLAYPSPPSGLLVAVLVAGVLLLGMTRAARAARRGDELAGITLTGLTGCLVSPVSWGHHLVWVVPAVVVLVDVAAARSPRRDGRTRVAAAAGAVAVTAVFCSSAVWFFAPAGSTGPPRSDLAGILGQDLYVLVMLALVALLPIRAPAARPARAEMAISAYDGR